MGPIKTTIVGSLPKPEWLADPERLRAPWRQDGSALAKAQDDAYALWNNAQEKAGLDIICDGEQRRRHYIWGFIEKLGKVDFENPAKNKAAANAIRKKHKPLVCWKSGAGLNLFCWTRCVSPKREPKNL